MARVWDGVVKPFVPADKPACQGQSDPTSARCDENDTAVAYQKRVCAGCPVFASCASHSMDHEPYGLWGLTEAQRWNLGGVVPKEWGNLIPNPDVALDELQASGISLDVVGAILGVGPGHPTTVALAARQRARAMVTVLRPVQDAVAEIAA